MAMKSKYHKFILEMTQMMIPSKHLHWRGTQHISHGGDQMPRILLLPLLSDFGSFSLLNKALIRFRVNAEGELNANGPTEAGFLEKAIIKFWHCFIHAELAMGILGRPHASWICTVHPIFLLLLDLTFSELP